MATSFNTQKMMYTDEDRDKLLTEINQVTYEDILTSHQQGRNMGDETSGLKIERVLAVWAHIQKTN